MIKGTKYNSVLNDKEDQNYAPRWITNYPGRLQPRLQPGVYMILCLANDYRYYGESSNISVRFAGHRRDLRRKKHSNSNLQKDWNLFGEEAFDFSALFIGEDWKCQENRIKREAELITANFDRSYNTYALLSDRVKELNTFYGKKHSEITKKLIGDLQRGIPKDSLGKKVNILGKEFLSVSQAAREMGISRKTVQKRLESTEYSDWFFLSETPNDYPNGSRGNASPEKTSNQE